MNINEMELRYGDCTVKRLSGGTLNAAMKNLTKFGYAGTRLGTIRVTAEFGRPVGEIVKNHETGFWYFTPDGQDPYSEHENAAGVMADIKAFIASEVEAAAADAVANEAGNGMTPGPWEFNECEDDAGRACIAITSDNRPGYIAGIHCAEGVSLDGRDIAAARAIAALPELVEALRGARVALQAAFDHLTSHGMFDHPVANRVMDADQTARVALVKAGVAEANNQRDSVCP